MAICRGGCSRISQGDSSGLQWKDRSLSADRHLQLWRVIPDGQPPAAAKNGDRASFDDGELSPDPEWSRNHQKRWQGPLKGQIKFDKI